LFDSSIDNAVGLLVGRAAGAAIVLVLHVGWHAMMKSKATTGIVTAMLLYASLH
jgi:hypothetical protein